MTSMNHVLSRYATRRARLEASKNPYAKGIAWVEGQLVPLREARIPLVDQGFLRSDLTYDVIAVWDGRFFRLDDHLSRLELACVKPRLKLPISRDEVKKTLGSMVAQSGMRDAYVALIVTRGLQSVRGVKPEDLVNNLYMLVQPYVWVMDPEVQRIGGSAIIMRTVRRVLPGAIDPTVKNLQWGSMYPFLTDGDGHLTEGSRYNIVLIKDGAIYTPDRGVLHGVTRTSVIDVARACGIQVHLEALPVELAYQCDEIFMCTTAGGIMPITELDGKPVNRGQIGPVTKKIWDGYWAMHYDPAYSFAVRYDDEGSKAKL
ncbi:aminotransferase class IV [Aspergillus neoniger CBS 115656]|uniref:Branched-chain amino acid aminotransferase n=1 Tax=Aspergillus neoniger (strain CBS 115656) TaxID=1448310 RepID=A0A318YT62_ASPNB|nr:branched-chain amino acid aminotransferase [Aspergillus neoniger CBS 115656]PYH31178.1 branched-chain amino acid aminotransferase [Aspergillus neoniger CBS 115656]